MVKVVEGKTYRALSVMIWVSEDGGIMLSGLPMGNPISMGLLNNKEDLELAGQLLGFVMSEPKPLPYD